MTLFFRGRGYGQEFFRLALSMGFSELEFLGQIARSSAVFGGWLQHPSPCLIRSAPRRERGWRLSETSDKCAKLGISNCTLQLLSAHG